MNRETITYVVMGVMLLLVLYAVQQARSAKKQSSLMGARIANLLKAPEKVSKMSNKDVYDDIMQDAEDNE